MLDEGGSELIRNRVLREALEKEAQVHRDGRARRGGLTPDNYVFSAPTPVAGAVRVGIEPRRARTCWSRATLLMSPEGELLRVEGDLVKRPSFWTKSVHLVRHYGRVDGTHVPVRLDMVAQVRIVGASRLSMTYQLPADQRPAGAGRRSRDLAADPRRGWRASCCAALSAPCGRRSHVAGIDAHGISR